MCDDCRIDATERAYDSSYDVDANECPAYGWDCDHAPECYEKGECIYDGTIECPEYRKLKGLDALPIAAGRK